MRLRKHIHIAEHERLKLGRYVGRSVGRFDGCQSTKEKKSPVSSFSQPAVIVPDNALSSSVPGFDLVLSPFLPATAGLQVVVLISA